MFEKSLLNRLIFFMVKQSKNTVNILVVPLKQLPIWRLFILFCFSIWFFFSRTCTIHRTAEEGGDYFFNFFLPLPLTSQTLRYQLGDYYRELTSAHSQQQDSNWEPLVSKHKLLTTKLHALTAIIVQSQQWKHQNNQ